MKGNSKHCNRRQYSNFQKQTECSRTSWDDYPTMSSLFLGQSQPLQSVIPFHTGATRLVKKFARTSFFDRVMNNCLKCPRLSVECVTISPLMSKCGRTSWSYSPLSIMNISIISPWCLLYTRVGSFKSRSLSSYSNPLVAASIFVALFWTASTASMSFAR